MSNPVIKFDNMPTELKAFIYQQINDLEPFLPEGAQAQVFVEDQENGKEVTATIQISAHGGSIKASISKKDAFTALAGAKESLIDQLVKIQSEIQSTETEDEIIHVTSSKSQLH